MQDVADDGAGGRGDDADHLRQKGQRLLARLVKQTSAASLRLRSSSSAIRRHAGGLDRLDDDLVLGRPG